MAVFQLRLLRARSSAIESRVFTAIRRQRARGGVRRYAYFTARRTRTLPSSASVNASVSRDWFDVDCRANVHAAKRTTRSLERVYRRHPTADTLAAWKNQFSTQRRLFRQKASDHWSTTIAECVGDARQLWFKITKSQNYTDCFSVTAHRVRSSAALYHQSRQDLRQHGVSWSAGYQRPSVYSAVYSVVVPGSSTRQSAKSTS